MALRSINLPGIGTKYELETEKKDVVAVFFLKNGNIQMYTLPHDSSDPSVAELTSAEARRLGTILTGAIMEADRESVEIAFSALSDLRISIHTYTIGKRMANKSLEELQIRARTGVTIIAVSRGEKNVINPPPSFVFHEGDTLVAIGETDQLKTFEREIMVD
ncbi:MAG TPA: TrkA C-terminal domain-containing protein [Methanoregulaceae archaeon]|jgi:TrkA domain protein|nr:cation:proton antiporter regulatory subunit [Methanolinea sp.]MDD5048747.1 TrkA C-terminal domain-containing protein [Methanoregulaceae archaeon]MDD5686017.1 TrkA C-terminal domain-containing protein [Methanoregulaceae archaeon]HOP66371.1 TrkA C-terminal domain-containing protein [Methanoregulaceae archaeon]HPJ74341.1 TrkA C-terminal domain-containing protein [Methanoregulaceae archaeon]